MELGIVIFPTQNGKLEELLRQFSTTWQLKKKLEEPAVAEFFWAPLANAGWGPQDS